MSACGCGCRAGTRPVTPVPSYNRPGLSALRYRMGVHGQFVASMLARLSSRPALAGLTTREPDDPAIALADGWAVVCDVLTFYQERIANEGYLRTATEPASIRHIGRLVGYQPRPPLGASGYLAYTLDPGAETTIPAGSQARSQASQGQLPQTFETSADLVAKADWNTLPVPLTLPPQITPNDVQAQVGGITQVLVAGTTTNLKPGDRLLFRFGVPADPAVRVVRSVRPDFPNARTVVELVLLPGQQAGLPGALADLGLRVGFAIDTAPKSRWSADLLRALTTLLGQVDTKQVPSADELVDILGDAATDLQERSAIAQARGGCVVADWLTEWVQPVVDADLNALRLAAEASASSLPEISDLVNLAQRLVGCDNAQSGEGLRVGAVVRPVRGDGDADPIGCPGEPVDCDAAVPLVGLVPMLRALRRQQNRPPVSARALNPSTCRLFAPDSDVHPKLLGAADHRLRPHLYPAWQHQRLAPPVQLTELDAMRVRAKPFLAGGTSVINAEAAPVEREPAGTSVNLTLDAVYHDIVVGSLVIIETAGEDTPSVARVVGATQQTVTQQVGTTGQTVDVPVTVLTLDRAVIPSDDVGLRKITVWAHGEPLQALGDPIADDIEGDQIPLTGPYRDLQPGRWLLVTGERTDVPHTSGVTGTELVMVTGVTQRLDTTMGGGRVGTTLLLANPLAYRYRRDTVRIFGNVVAATQGETRDEVLGSGDATRRNQSFPLRQATAQTPLDSLPADNPLGARDTLIVRVGGVRWHETDLLVDSGPTEHDYALRLGADGGYTVTFGDGEHGARPPTGVENVTATYRIGAGASGNVAAGAVNQLTSRPLGVRAVTNPLPTTGGADGDGPGDARETTPLRTAALDRLVSVSDYATFTRARAGIGKADAQRLSDGREQVVHVTVAGVDDVPIDPTDRLFTDLRAALADFGDGRLPVRVAVRDLVLIVLSAGVRVLPDCSWDLVEPAVRAAVLDTLGFAAAEPGRPAFLSRVLAAMQAVSGVDYVDVDVFGGVDGDAGPIQLAQLVGRLRGAAACVPARPARSEVRHHRVASGNVSGHDTLTSVACQYGLTLDELAALNPNLTTNDLRIGTELVVFRGIRPAQLAVLSPEVPETLTLRRIP